MYLRNAPTQLMKNQGFCKQGLSIRSWPRRNNCLHRQDFRIRWEKKCTIIQKFRIGRKNFWETRFHQKDKKTKLWLNKFCCSRRRSHWCGIKIPQRQGVHTIFGTPLPWATLIVNVVGCFLMGIAYTLLLDKYQVSDSMRLFVMMGVLGALTTWSTFFHGSGINAQLWRIF